MRWAQPLTVTDTEMAHPILPLLSDWWRPLVTDFANNASVGSAAAGVQDEHGALEVLINNAGIA